MPFPGDDPVAPAGAGAELQVNKGVPGGYAPLGPDGLVPDANLPARELFVFDPLAAGPVHPVYNDWSAMFAAISLLPDGVVPCVRFLNNFTVPTVGMPVNGWDMRGGRWWSYSMATGAVLVTIPDGAKIDRLAVIENGLAVEVQPTTADGVLEWTGSVGGVRILMLGVGSALWNSGTKAMILTPGNVLQTFVVIAMMAPTEQITPPLTAELVKSQGNDVIIVSQILNGAYGGLPAGWLTGTGAMLIYQNGIDAQMNPIPGWLGPAPFIINGTHALNLNYDDTIQAPASGATNVQAVIDWLKTQIGGGGGLSPADYIRFVPYLGPDMAGGTGSICDVYSPQATGIAGVVAYTGPSTADINCASDPAVAKIRPYSIVGMDSAPGQALIVINVGPGNVLGCVVLGGGLNELPDTTAGNLVVYGQPDRLDIGSSGAFVEYLFYDPDDAAPRLVVIQGTAWIGPLYTNSIGWDANWFDFGGPVVGWSLGVDGLSEVTGLDPLTKKLIRQKAAAVPNTIDLVVAPGATSGEHIYPDFATMHAAYIALTSLPITPPRVRILFDEDGGAITVPVGTWAFTNAPTVWESRDVTKSVTVTFDYSGVGPTWAKIDGIHQIRGLKLRSSAPSGGHINVPSNTSLYLSGVNCLNTAGGAIFDFIGGTIVVGLDELSNLQQGSINQDFAGIPLIALLEGTSVQTDAIIGTAGLMVLVWISDTIHASTIHSGFTGTVFPFWLPEISGSTASRPVGVPRDGFTRWNSDKYRLETYVSANADWEIPINGGGGLVGAQNLVMGDTPDQDWSQAGATTYTIVTPPAGRAGFFRVTITNGANTIAFTNTIVWKGGVPVIIGTKQLFEFYWNGSELIGEYTNLA